MTDLADFETLFQTAIRLNNTAVTLQERRHYLLAHETLKDAMLCMQLILRPEHYGVWPTMQDMALKINLADERVHMAEERPLGKDNPVGDDTGLQENRFFENSRPLYIVESVVIDYGNLDQTGVDLNSAIIVFNFGLTYLGLAICNTPQNRKILYEASVELFYLSYSILVKLSVETDQLDFCEYILRLSMKILRQTIDVDSVIGRNIEKLENLLHNAEESFAVLHHIGQSSVAAAA